MKAMVTPVNIQRQLHSFLTQEDCNSCRNVFAAIKRINVSRKGAESVSGIWSHKTDRDLATYGRLG